jgi:hypothetical protein
VQCFGLSQRLPELFLENPKQGVHSNVVANGNFERGWMALPIDVRHVILNDGGEGCNQSAIGLCWVILLV